MHLVGTTGASERVAAAAPAGSAGRATTKRTCVPLLLSTPATCSDTISIKTTCIISKEKLKTIYEKCDKYKKISK